MKTCFNDQLLILRNMEKPSSQCPNYCGANIPFKNCRLCFYIHKQCSYYTCYTYNSDLSDIFKL